MHGHQDRLTGGLFFSGPQNAAKNKGNSFVTQALVAATFWSLTHMGALSATLPTAAVLPADFKETKFSLADMKSPSGMAIAPDGRVFIAEQDGTIRIFKGGQLLAKPFAKVDAMYVLNRSWEAGLLTGMIFDPAFPAKPYLYLFYTRKTSATQWTPVVSRLKFAATNDDVSDGSEEDLVTLLPDTTRSHVGGAMVFGGDGKIYLTSGNYDSPPNSQNPNTIKGKLLRFNPDGSIPADNPQATTAQGPLRAIWCTGLRSPYGMVTDPVKGDVYFLDVGDNTYNKLSVEEINKVVKGANYGYMDVQGPSTDPKFTSPYFSYTHDDPMVRANNLVLAGASAITPGAVYAGVTPNFPASYQGKLFFSDYDMGRIFALPLGQDKATWEPFASGLPFPANTKIAPDGTMWVLCRGREQGEGVITLHHIEYTKAVSIMPHGEFGQRAGMHPYQNHPSLFALSPKQGALQVGLRSVNGRALLPSR